MTQMHFCIHKYYYKKIPKYFEMYQSIVVTKILNTKAITVFDSNILY